MVHAITICMIAMNNAIVIITITIASHTMDTTIAMCVMLVMIVATRIASLIAITITRLASMIFMITTASAIIINQELVPTRTIMSCTSMMATKQTGLSCKAHLPPPGSPGTQGTPLLLLLPPAAGPDLPRTTKLLAKDTTVLSSA